MVCFSRRLGLWIAVVFTAFFLVACSESGSLNSPTAPTAGGSGSAFGGLGIPPSTLPDPNPRVVVGELFKVCKDYVGGGLTPDVVINVSVNTGEPTLPLSLADGECAWAWTHDTGDSTETVTVTEVVPDDYEASWATFGLGGPIASGLGNVASGPVDGNGVPAAGTMVIFTNTFNPPPPPLVEGRFTGGLRMIVDDLRITGGLTIHCDMLLSNNFEINWERNSFHMTEHLDTVECSDNLPQQHPPDAPLDTLIGTGTGRYNGVDGFDIAFTLVDAGEPGRNDMATILITDPSNGDAVVLSVSGNLSNGGNLQAHEDQPHRNR